MKQLNFSIKIKSSAKKVWQVLWSDTTYRKWAAVFKEGSYAVSDWKTGSKVHFLSPDGNGIFSVIDACIPNERMEFRHSGELKNFMEQPETPGSKAWSGSSEKYSIHPEDGYVRLDASLETTNEFAEYFESTFPKALLVIQKLAENPIVLTIQADISAPLAKVWKYWTLPEHIVRWNQASDDWHTTHALNDLKPGGKFLSRMEAKDGSFGFDFEGTYTLVEPSKKIQYKIADGRNVTVRFQEMNDTVQVVSDFEAEEENAPEFQQAGWLAILQNFKKYTENN